MIRHATDTGVKDSRRYLSVFGNLVLWSVIIIDAWFLWPASLGGNTSLIIVSGDSMEPTFSSGDLVIARKGEPDIGDVIVYEPPEAQGARVVHRIIAGDAENGWVLQGDNNDWRDPWFPTDDQVVGIVRLHFPRVGLMGTVLLNPWTWGFLLIIAAGLVLWPDDDDEEDDDIRDRDLVAGRT